MTEKLEKLQEYKDAGNKMAFNNILIEFLPQFRKVVHLRLRQLEKNGLIPVNMYSAQEIVDDVYLKIFEDFSDELIDPNRLKVKMYSIARDILENLKEKHFKKKISVEKLYRDELKELEEEFTADADGELVLIEDLDDISYHLDEFKDKILLLDAEQVDELVNGLDIIDDKPISENTSKKISRVYSKLPELSQSVVNHFVFGKLSTTEIAEIHKIPEEIVTEIIEKIKKRLKSIF